MYGQSECLRLYSDYTIITMVVCVSLCMDTSDIEKERAGKGKVRERMSLIKGFSNGDIILASSLSRRGRTVVQYIIYYYYYYYDYIWMIYSSLLGYIFYFDIFVQCSHK